MQRRIVSLVLLATLGVVALAYDASVDVAVRWRVLPYQSLTVAEAGGDPSRVFVLRPEGAVSPDGFVDSLVALRLHVASNVPWQLHLRLDDSTPLVGLEARCGGTSAPLSQVPVVLASGSHGAYDLAVDLRWSGAALEGSQGVRLIAMIAPQ